MIDVCNFLKISPQKSAAFVAREYNKTQKANNERSIATREAGMSGPPTILAYALNKTNTPSGSPSKVYNKEGCEIRKYDGKNPF